MLQVIPGLLPDPGIGGIGGGRRYEHPPRPNMQENQHEYVPQALRRPDPLIEEVALDQRGRMSVERQGSDVLVSVKDNGIGIAARWQVPHIYEMYSQAAPAVARCAWRPWHWAVPLVKGMVDLHGGTIEAHSDGPGNGSEFVVRLPLDRTFAGATSAKRGRKQKLARKY